VSYFAEMFCYGKAHTHVGITGIKNCYGIIYVGAHYGYAIHIPYQTKDDAMLGATTFIRHVKNNEGSTGANGHLFGFINGSNWNLSTREHRTSISGPELLEVIKKGLGSRRNSPAATLYRIRQHLGPNSGGDSAKAVVIMIERVHVNDNNADGCVKLYRAEDEITYEHYGSPPDGQYKGSSRFGTLHRNPTNMGQAAGWHPMDAVNCIIVNI
jgi:hypothetical protein